MNIWLVKTGEPIPSDGENVRLMRMGILADYLSKKGHQVIWWNAKFNHSSKKFRDVKNPIRVSENLEIKLLDSIGYKKNVSLKRLMVDHTQLSKNFKTLASKEEKPDVILASFPTIGLSLASVKYGQKYNIPVIIDLRDLWPEAFLDSFPSFSKKIVKVILTPMYSKAKYTLSNATGLVGISQPFLDWGLKLAGRPTSNFDAVFPFGYKKLSVNQKVVNYSQFPFLNTTNNNQIFTFCYIGNLSYNLNLKPVAEALSALKNNNIKFQFIICGRGVAQKDFENLFKDFDNVHFTGFINATQIATIMRYTDLGIVPYVNTPNFQKTISNKVIEYLAGSLPIITSITGYMGPHLKKHNSGITYNSSDELIQYFKELSTNREQLAQMKKSALELYEKNFKAENVYRNFANHLINIVELNNENSK
jgi:glycosyltransferase involved in cell wall biosynthesis